MNRRAFFERSARWLSATLLAFLGGYLALENGVDDPASCKAPGFCRQCRAFSGCQRPEALEHRTRHSLTSQKQADER